MKKSIPISADHEKSVFLRMSLPRPLPVRRRVADGPLRESRHTPFRDRKSRSASCQRSLVPSNQCRPYRCPPESLPARCRHHQSFRASKGRDGNGFRGSAVGLGIQPSPQLAVELRQAGRIGGLKEACGDVQEGPFNLTFAASPCSGTRDHRKAVVGGEVGKLGGGFIGSGPEHLGGAVVADRRGSRPEVFEGMLVAAGKVGPAAAARRTSQAWSDRTRWSCSASNSFTATGPFLQRDIGRRGRKSSFQGQMMERPYDLAGRCLSQMRDG